MQEGAWKNAHGIFPIILQVFPNKKTCSQIAAGILQSELRCATDHWTNCVLHLFFAPGRQWSALTISTSRHLLTPLPAPLSSRPFLNEQTKVLRWMLLWEHFFYLRCQFSPHTVSFSFGWFRRKKNVIEVVTGRKSLNKKPSDSSHKG